MAENEPRHSLLQRLPGVDRILVLAQADPFLQNISKSILVRSIRTVIDNLRADVLSGKPDATPKRLSDPLILDAVKANVRDVMSPNLLPVINATGVVVHTNLGRSVLCEKALEQLSEIAGRYSNLEFDLSTGKRGSRYAAVENILCELSGAESALVVNNNAGAVFLCLDTLAKNKKVIISRGELVEIGGSFRIPDVMAKSGAILTEVGTTNRTHMKDYESAIGQDTGLLLKVHKSNYSVEGFTAEVSLNQLVTLAKKYRITVMEDLGSGTFIDFSSYGLLKEPTVRESVHAGADVVTFSGDKLLGGPQAGIIVGQKDILDRVKKNPVTRALRVDKLTLAALEATLSLYRDEKTAVQSIPTLRMMTLSLDAIRKKAARLQKQLKNIGDPRLLIKSLKLPSRVGGGALPLQKLPSVCLGIKIQSLSAVTIERHLRKHTPPIIGRIEDDYFIMDLRTVQTREFAIIVDAFTHMLKKV